MLYALILSLPVRGIDPRNRWRNEKRDATRVRTKGRREQTKLRGWLSSSPMPPISPFPSIALDCSYCTRPFRSNELIANRNAPRLRQPLFTFSLPRARELTLSTRVPSFAKVQPVGTSVISRTRRNYRRSVSRMNQLGKLSICISLPGKKNRDQTCFVNFFRTEGLSRLQ